MSATADEVLGAPAADQRGFRRCLGQFSTGVTIIATEHEGQRVGVTANSFSSLSLDPPLILWSIGRTSRAFPVFMEAPRFAISILAEDQVDVSQRFSSKDTDKFTGIAWQSGENGAPVIANSAARLECQTEARHEGGDHVLIIGRVTRFAYEDRKVLIFSQGRYSIGVDHPVLQGGGAAAGGAAGATADVATTLGALLFRAHLCSSRGFDRYRDSLGLSIGASRILFVLSEAGELSFEALVREVDLPAQTIEDDLADLTAKGDIRRTMSGTIGLTPAGRDHYARVRRLIDAHEADTLKSIPAADLQKTKETLARFVEQTDPKVWSARV